ncbi:MAG TPA: PQQ-binding-like beta-propeller repeat protein [Actinomycetes bacterium]
MRLTVTRREALVLLGAAGLAACGQATTTGAEKRGATTAADQAGRQVPSTAGCDPSKFPPRRAAVVAFDADGKRRWSVPLPVGADLDANVGPLVDGDTVFTTEGDELRALAAADGRQRWRLPLGGVVYDASIRDGVLVVRAGPLDAGQLLGVETASGRVRWRYPAQPAQLSWQHGSTADGGIVAVGAVGALVVLNRQDGAVRWSRRPRGHGTPKVFTEAGDRVLRLDRGTLEAFDAATGRALWRTAGVHRGADFEATLTVSHGGVVVWDQLSSSNLVAAYELDSGVQRWNLGGLREPAVVGVGPAGVAVVSVIDRNRRHELLLVDPASGTPRWRRGLPGPLSLDMNPAVDRLALVTGDDVVLVTPGPRGEPPTYLAAYRAGDGHLRWRMPVQADGWPAWTRDGRLLVVGSVSTGGNLQQSLSCVDVRRGRSLWVGALPMVADRPATPLGAGAVIQAWDPGRACAGAQPDAVR